jgi:uncharacterized protein involved in tellurium resistance
MGCEVSQGGGTGMIEIDKFGGLLVTENPTQEQISEALAKEENDRIELMALYKVEERMKELNKERERIKALDVRKLFGGGKE